MDVGQGRKQDAEALRLCERLFGTSMHRDSDLLSLKIQIMSPTRK